MEAEQLRVAAQVFADLPDVRKNRGLNHSLVNLIVIALCAVMSGADTFPEIQAFGETKREWLKSFLRMLAHSGPPRSIHVATCAELTWPPAALP